MRVHGFSAPMLGSGMHAHAHAGEGGWMPSASLPHPPTPIPRPQRDPLARTCTHCPGLDTMRWQSRNASVCLRRLATMGAPMVKLGTK